MPGAISNVSLVHDDVYETHVQPVVVWHPACPYL